MSALRTAALALTALAGLAALPRLALAQGGQAAVYDPQPPAGSAYVRFVNALGGAVTVRPDFLPALQLGTAPAQRVTPYTVVEKVAERTLALDAGLAQKTGHAAIKAAPGSYVTILLHRGEDGGVAVTPVVDPTEYDRARAKLGFYNAASECPQASLAIEGGPAVFEAVAPGTAKSRSVKPVTAQLRAACGGQAAPAFALDGLDAGNMYSIWLMRPEGSALTAFITRDTTARWKP